MEEAVSEAEQEPREPTPSQGSLDETAKWDLWNAQAWGVARRLDELKQQRDAALAHLRDVAPLLLCGTTSVSSRSTLTWCSGDEDCCPYEHRRYDDGRERLIRGHSEDCPLGWLEGLGE